MRARPPPHPTNTTARRLSRFPSSALTHTPSPPPVPPPSLRPPYSLLLPPRAPCRSPPSRASPPGTRYRSADEFEVLRILRGVLLTTRSSAAITLSLSLPSFSCIPTCRLFCSAPSLRTPLFSCRFHAARAAPLFLRLLSRIVHVIGSRLVFTVLGFYEACSLARSALLANVQLLMPI